ncbi:hypothetical protein Tco_0006816 [Tanacetum coccineum]
MGVLSIFDREDLKAVYELVMEKYQDEIPEGFDKMLWGDLIIMFNQGDTADFWDEQLNWKIISWKLHSSSGVHTIMTSNGLVIHMLVENRYPLTKEVLSQLLDLKLETEEDSTMALELIKFVKQQLEEFEDSDDDDLAKSDHEEAERECKFKGQKRSICRATADEELNHALKAFNTVNNELMMICGIAQLLRCLGYGIQSNAEVLGYEEEISREERWQGKLHLRAKGGSMLIFARATPAWTNTKMDHPLQHMEHREVKGSISGKDRCGKKLNVLFTEKECLWCPLTQECPDRKSDTYLFISEKPNAEEATLWHRRLYDTIYLVSLQIKLTSRFKNRGHDIECQTAEAAYLMVVSSTKSLTGQLEMPAMLEMLLPLKHLGQTLQQHLPLTNLLILGNDNLNTGFEEVNPGTIRKRSLLDADQKKRSSLLQMKEENALK